MAKATLNKVTFEISEKQVPYYEFIGAKVELDIKETVIKDVETDYKPSPKGKKQTKK